MRPRIHVRASFARSATSTPAVIARDSSCSREAKIAPSTAVPTDPPIESKQCRTRCRDTEILVVDRILRREHEHLHHHSEPKSERHHEDCSHAERSFCVHSRQQKSPSTITAVPIIGKILYRPRRLMS